MKKIKYFVTASLSIIAIVFVVGYISLPHFSSLIINNYEIRYDSSKFILDSVKDVEIGTYLSGIEYYSGYIHFKTIDGNTKIIYSLRDIELPPSNALNDISPISKSSQGYKIYNIDEKFIQFKQILCKEEMQRIKCRPVTGKYNSIYNYGDELKRGGYFFEYRIKALDLENINMYIEINASEYPTLDFLKDVLKIQKSIEQAVKE